MLNYFSMGAMGLASSHGLGLALGQPDKRIVVLDGDGSLLMNLGTLVTIGAQAPKNLVHFVCHNGCYEANGGHPIPNAEVDFTGLARAAGYRRTHDFSELTSFEPQYRPCSRTGRPGVRHAPSRERRAAAGIRLQRALFDPARRAAIKAELAWFVGWVQLAKPIGGA